MNFRVFGFQRETPMATSSPPFRRRRLGLAGLAALTLALSTPAAPALGQEGGDEAAFEWIDGPATGRLGSHAEIEIPAGYRFLDGRGAKAFLAMLENPPTDREVGLVLPADPGEDDDFWFVVFEYDALGYVKDDEKDDLDADGILDSIRDGTERANEERARRGWGSVHVVGWERPPFYNEGTHNLEWAIRGRSDDGDSINYSTRLLGRRGVMSADLVLGPDQLAAVTPAYQELLGGFRFRSGETYAEFTKGDKIATYGLTALVAGGAGAVAAKTGLLARFWKLIVAGVLGVGAFFRRMFSRRPRPGPEGEPPAIAPGG